MIRYAAVRIAQAVPLILGASVLTWVLIHIAPGDPIVALAGEDGNAEYYERMRARFGLDEPLIEQLWIYLQRLAAGDLGFSFRQNSPAVDVIVGQLPATLLLVVPALSLAAVGGVTLGALAAAKRGTGWDTALRTVTLLGHSVPVFWLAQILLLVFAVRLDWFPVQGRFDVRADHEGIRSLLDQLHHMALPVLALATVYLPPIMRVTRASVIESLQAPYMAAARARGLSQRAALVRHAVPNALLPIATVVGAQVGFMVAGAVLVETVFAWPGLGRLLLGAMLNRDYAIITAMLLLISITVIVANLLTDLLYAFLDPRVRHRR